MLVEIADPANEGRRALRRPRDAVGARGRAGRGRRRRDRFGGDSSTGRIRARPSRSCGRSTRTCSGATARTWPEDWERSQLADGDLEWLQSLPLTATRRRRSLLPRDADEQSPDHDGRHPAGGRRRTFAGVTGTVVIGHTHHQFDRRIGDLRVVNAGSVGMPYEGEVAAFWTLVEDGEPSFRRTPFDVERPSPRRGRATGRSLRASSTRTCSSRSTRDEAIARLESRRA